MPVSDVQVAPWNTLSKGAQEDWVLMRLRREQRKHGVDGREGTFVIASAPHWVNILPITENGGVVLVEQFRHGIGKPSLEIPGGILHEGEDPREAAQRECLEETGWGADTEAQLLGVVDPNPAFMENVCSMYVWNNCRQVRAQHLDPLEDIAVHVVSMNEFFSLVKTGAIRHSLVLSAVALALVQSRLSPGSMGNQHG